MSDNPEGPGWWIASDGRWYPPELHPSVRADSPTPTGATEAGGTPGTTWSGPERREGGDRRNAEGTHKGSAETTEAGGAPGSTWSGPERRWQDRRKADGAEPVGPQFPDLFQKALQGSHLADNVSVRYDGDPGRAAPGSDGKGRAPAASAAGGGSGPASKRRRRKGG